MDRIIIKKITKHLHKLSTQSIKQSTINITIEALAHYYEVLPDWVISETEQEGFEGEILEVFDDHNY